jgi:hypothetical protein
MTRQFNRLLTIYGILFFASLLAPLIQLQIERTGNVMIDLFGRVHLVSESLQVNGQDARQRTELG